MKTLTPLSSRLVPASPTTQVPMTRTTVGADPSAGYPSKSQLVALGLFAALGAGVYYLVRHQNEEDPEYNMNTPYAR